MSKAFDYCGLTIRVDSGTLYRVEKKGSIYDHTVMVVAPFVVYNTGSTKKRISNDDYIVVVKGSRNKFSVKADYAFNDSFLYKWVAPKKEEKGFIRIPYKGPGRYGVVFKKMTKKPDKEIIWSIGKIPDASIPVNSDTMRPKINSFEHKTRFKKHGGRSAFSDDDGYHMPDELDVYDSYIVREKRYSTEFGYGRKRSAEWNNTKAMELRRELEKARIARKSDPNSFDRNAIK